jgi:AraC-like DNA-binding protein
MSDDRTSYREEPPSPALARHVQAFWMLSALAPKTPWAPSRVFPDGCIDLIFDFTADKNRARFIGTMTRPIIVVNQGALDTFAIRFLPGAARSVVGVPAIELTDRDVPITELWDHDPTEELRPLSTRARIERLEQLLMKKLSPLDPLIAAAVKMIASRHGDLEISQLERATGWSTRQLERKFRDFIGVSPKRFARVMRLQRVLRAAEHARGAWLEVALELGYSDQAHLAREVKELTGLSPSELAHV